MARRYRFTLLHLICAMTLVSVSLGLARCSLIVIEDVVQKEALRVHPSEEKVANYIRVYLKGACNVDKANSRHITGVWLENTRTTDEDIDVILQLPYLTHLDISNTEVSSKSIEKLLSHKKLRYVKISGSKMNVDELREACVQSGHYLGIEE